MADDTNLSGRPTMLSSIEGDDPINIKILTSIVNLSNHILETTATRELTK